MFKKTKREIALLERQLENSHRIIDAKEAEISTLKVQSACYERLVARLEAENKAEAVLIDGLESENTRARASLAYIDTCRKEAIRERDIARRENADLKKTIRSIEREGLCSVCEIGASRAECGVTCNFKYIGGNESVRPETKERHPSYDIPYEGYTWNPNKNRYEVYIDGELRGTANDINEAAAVYEEARK